MRITVALAGAIIHGAPLDLRAAGETVEIPSEKIESRELVYRVASPPPGLEILRGDFLIVEPRPDRAATGELVIAVAEERIFIGRWWCKHGRRSVVGPGHEPMVEDERVRVLGAVTVVVRYAV